MIYGLFTYAELVFLALFIIFAFCIIFLVVDFIMLPLLSLIASYIQLVLASRIINKLIILGFFIFILLLTKNLIIHLLQIITNIVK